MTLISDQDYLKNQQYKSPDNLSARIQIHQRFSTNPLGWNRWVFDQLHLREGMRILELGSGKGLLWRENIALLPGMLQVVLTDFSLGMLNESREHLGADGRFWFAEVDAQAIPFPTGCFDLVVANHMLYHVPDLPIALEQIQRVLNPNGYFAAATNGSDHMRELYDMMRHFDPTIREDNSSAARFGLQNGSVLLAPFFNEPDVLIYEDALRITEAKPLVDYIMSMWSMGLWNIQRKADLERVIAERIERDGKFFIRKSTGMFWAQPRGGQP